MKRPHWPDPFEAERLVAEARLGRKVKAAFAAIRPAIFAELEQDLKDRGLRGPGTAEVAVGAAAFNEAFWLKQRKAFYAKIGDQTEQMVKAGVQQAAQLGVAVNLEAVNQAVSDYVRIYQDQWWSQLSGTMQTDLRTALQKNIETGNLAAMKRDLAPTFGAKRADLVARTETTRLYAEGNRLAYKADGVQQVEWMTVADEHVDPTCRGLEGTKMPVDGAAQGYPPAHPDCRCWIAPVIGDKTVEQALEDGEPTPLLSESANLTPSRLSPNFLEAREQTAVMNDALSAKFGAQSEYQQTVRAMSRWSNQAEQSGFRQYMEARLAGQTPAAGFAYADEAETLLTALGRAPKINRALYRGIWSDRTLAQELAQWQVGETVDVAASSTSYLRSAAKDFASRRGSHRGVQVMWQIEKGAQGVPLNPFLEGVRGVSGGGMSEWEVLVQGRYKITGVVVDGQTIKVKLSQLGRFV